MTGQAVIRCEGLTKSYGKTEALRGLDLAVPQGSLCGFVGRNGAGKTTTLKILLGLLRTTSGRAEVFGLPCDSQFASLEIRTRAAFINESKALLPYMNVEQTIAFTRGFFPGWRRDLEDKYVRLFELPLERKICGLSKGMLSKLHLLLALARGCELLVMDEPTDGLDPVVTEQVLQVLVDYVADGGGTVLFSTHRLAEVEQICDRIAMIDQGRCLLDESLDDLKDRCRLVRIVFAEEASKWAAELSALGRVRHSGRSVSMLVQHGAEQAVARAQALGAVSVEVTPVSLKELFLETVGG